MSFQQSPLSALTLETFLALATTAYADLKVRFNEGAPKDRFTIQNTGTCAITASSIVIDLSKSQGGLIFDVTGSGEGVEVYQPFEVVEGSDALAAMPTVRDGQTRVELEIKRLAPGQSIAFTIDVDDTLGQRAITVTGSELDGAMTSYSNGAQPISASFSSPTAVIPIPDCS